MPQALVPAWLRTVNFRSVRADLLAGLLGALLALPQGVAFATLAGLPPQYGIYSAVVPCIVAALFGSSLHVISGPTNANSLALFAMVSPMAAAGSPEYINFALGITVLVGVLQLLIAVLRLGSLANFISPSVLAGFTSGAALLIGLYALRDLFGLEVPSGTSALGAVNYLLMHFNAINWGACLVGTVTMGATYVCRRLSPRLPYVLMGLSAGFGIAYLLNRAAAYGVPHIRVIGAIPSAIPPFQAPKFSWETLPDMLGRAVALTVVAIGQSISIAKAVGMRSGQRIDSNREILGQGLSNLVGGFFSSYVSCGSLNRSMPNFEAGAQTPLAGVFSAALLMLLVLSGAVLLAQIPLAAISAMLVLVAWNLFDVAQLKRMARLSRIDFGIAVATLIATLVLRLEMAVVFGIALSLIAYLYQTSRPAIRTLLPAAGHSGRAFTPVDELGHRAPQCPQLKLLRIEGAIFFGAVPHVQEQFVVGTACQAGQTHVLAMVKSMNFIDLAAAEMWEKELADRRAKGGDLYFHSPRRQVMQTWERTGFLKRLGEQHIFNSKREALRHIVPRLDAAICAACRTPIFNECRAQRRPDIGKDEAG